MKPLGAGEVSVAPFWPLNNQPAFGYHQAMHKAVLILLVGLTLSFSDGATALTFGKDGKVSHEGQLDSATPEPFLSKVAKTKLLKLRYKGSTNGYYDREWSLCTATAHNISFVLAYCSPTGQLRKQVIGHTKNKKITDFSCWHRGKLLQSAHPENGKFAPAGRRTYECSNDDIEKTLWMAAQLTKIVSNPDHIVPKPTKHVSKTSPTASTSSSSITSVASTSDTNTSSSAAKRQNSDAGPPTISIVSNAMDGPQAKILGRVFDEAGISEVIIDGSAVSLGDDGSFTASFYVPRSGKTVEIVAFDTKGNKALKSLFLERGKVQQARGPKFDDLNPLVGKRVISNKNALALIVGIADYERTDAPAIYADKDAQYFHDYASLKLGIPDSNITTLVNDNAEQGDVLLAVKDWIRRSSKAGQSDVYVFFAGHGLASQDGEQMYLLPYDGRPRLLENTAILRDELFTDLAAANPRSVTVFLDTCYSGTTRGTDMLIASRPIAIRAKAQAVPEGFTVMTAAAGDQTAKPLEEAKHGMFSYFLMKGMEGDADKNRDNQITAGELHAYVQQNVIQQSSGSQTPELQGDADRVLVRFQ